MSKQTTDDRRTLLSLRRELRSEEFRKLRPERAFIGWYVKARYGPNASCEITDGKGDGGIDAIAIEGGTRVVIQSKYHHGASPTQVSLNELSAFEILAARVREPGREADFNRWLAKVRPELHSKYRSLRDLAISRPEAVRFDFVTTRRCTRVVEDDINMLDIERVSSLWRLYEEGFTPPVEQIELKFDHIWNVGDGAEAFSNYVGLANVEVFLNLMKSDEHERLFAQNVRTDLRSRINAEIRRTYEREPETFWLGNNGLYVVCNRATLRAGTLTLVYPSIINGSQTLHAIFQSHVRHPCRILVRALEMNLARDRSLLNSIVRRTNSQNPMKPMNLAAHDREQLNVARFLDGLQVFYERREREWVNEKKAVMPEYQPVTMRDVGQWTAVTFGGIGFGVARARVTELFLDPIYRRLFGRFGDNLTDKAYEQLAISVFSGLLVKRYIKSLNARKKREKIVHLLLTKAVFDAVDQSPTLRSAAMELVRRGRYDAGQMREVKAALNSIQTEMVKAQRAAERGDPTLDLSNFFKRDELAESAYKKAVSSVRFNRLRRSLEKAG